MRNVAAILYKIQSICVYSAHAFYCSKRGNGQLGVYKVIGKERKVCRLRHTANKRNKERFVCFVIAFVESLKQSGFHSGATFCSFPARRIIGNATESIFKHCVFNVIPCGLQVSGYLQHTLLSRGCHLRHDTIENLKIFSRKLCKSVGNYCRCHAIATVGLCKGSCEAQKGNQE